MNLRLDLRVFGGLIALTGAFQSIPLIAALVFAEPITPYLYSILIAFTVGITLLLGVRTDDTRIRPRDGFFIVGTSWLLVSLFGALPYLLSGTLGPVDAIFESTSGFTTTGSTVIADVTRLPHSLLLWRSFTQWLGGMGIILFTIAILPLLGIGGMQLFRAEVPGPIASKLRPRLTDTARRLWYVYLGLTVAALIALRLAGLDLWTALNHSLTTMASGGFSTLEQSIGSLNSPLVEWIITVFMLLSGVNFVLHYRILSGRGRIVLGDRELHYYLLVLGIATLLLWTVLVVDGRAVGASLRSAAFQAVSLITTTGYTTEDFELWPEIAQVMLLIFMLPGGMAGSTSGGMKSLRCLLALRAMRATIDRLLHPHAVRPVKYSNRPVPDSVLSDMWVFFAVYFLTILAGAVVVAASGYDLRTSLSAGISAVGNIGPGLGEIGARDHFGHMPAPTKLFLAFCMVAGRLELFTLLVIILPGFWRR
jgi:trk system potassium uptake protein TrkH